MIKVFVNGSFDVLHRGHLELLKFAREQGDYLHVAIDSDRRITEKKGPQRPFNNELNRLALMSSIRFVDCVSVFDSDSKLTQIINDYAPDIMIVGSDWKGKTIIGSEHAKHVVFFDRVNNESTTATIESYVNRRCLL